MIVNYSTDINKYEQYGASHLTPLKTNKIITFGDDNDKGSGLIRNKSVERADVPIYERECHASVVFF